MKTREQSAPRARKEGLVVQDMPDELLVYDLDRHKAHCLNQTAALVWKRCDGKTSVKQMVRLLEKDTECPVDEAVVWLAFDQLSKANLLQGQTSKWPGASGISRREVIRRVGLAAAVSLPIVTSIVAPKAAAAINCRASGQPCTTSAQCCSGVCTGGTTCA
ncbi:MAG TPA: PqqD family peptide modification chaperone [Blastocatellia bacterium]|nr:PqqD family peptide modification chaperone [Blastocatellia bacterium]